MKIMLDLLEGPVDPAVDRRKDVVIVEIPPGCVGWVTGSNRETLSAIEETTGTLMFFLGEHYEARQNQGGKLAIFGSQRSRKWAELEVKFAVERKLAGHFSQYCEDVKTTTESFDTDCLTLDLEDVAYAIGQRGSTRLKLAKASGAILQFVGNKAFIAGTKIERRRCRDYLGWLLEQKDNSLTLDLRGRTDTSEVSITEDQGKLLHGDYLTDMRRIEEESGTFCIVAIAPTPRIVICGEESGEMYRETGRYLAEKELRRLVGSMKVGGHKRRERSRSRERGYAGWSSWSSWWT
mmetsp:Transcript_22786/g.50163  ORF Transcript_22786/g.50163 Transcript_22786/m.50163 type:complete len:293 (+) Transcript_22786:589-1467(+)